MTGLNLYSPLVAVVGAVVFLVAYHAIRCILYSDALRLLSRKVQTGKLLHPAEAVHLRIVAEEKKTKVPKETVPARPARESLREGDYKPLSGDLMREWMVQM